ncbi:protein-glutamine gamma-glutamyltransferase [Piscibacillus halophilus]|uniref:protein-glutamine gamma-glutamyltransferase n=1 Tax=Piscibacillus halophilus TaxID=571933 RepID=UPI00158C0D36|nr:protein-glutamine gamma-glutamyltransferase [Piscibacillus halophilus]
MIRVAGNNLQNVNYLSLDPIERVIFNSLLSDPLTYAYQSMYELEFEITLRKNIMNSARLMNQSQAEFEVFANSRCNPEFWTRTILGGFKLKSNVEPADAIEDIYLNSHLYGFECATAMLIIYYHSVLNTIDKQQFNRLFKNLYLYSWHADSDLRLQNIDTEHLIPGDIVYFKNPDVNPRTPWWQGENAVVMEDGSYFGHGIGITSADQILNFLNQNRRSGSTRSAYLVKTLTRPHFRYLANVTSMRTIISNKPQLEVIHHDEPSIPSSKYLYYLNMFYLKK